MAELSGRRTAAGLGGPEPLLEMVSAQKRGLARGFFSVCSAHPIVLQSAFEEAREDASAVLVESTCNQVNQEGGYTGATPAEFVAFASRLAAESGMPGDRVVLGGDHLGPNPWTALGSFAAMERAGAMVRDYVRAGYTKVHLDASMRCADDPPGPLTDTVAAARTADLAAAAEAAAAEHAPGLPPPVYVIGTEVPTPGGQAGEHGGPAVTRVEDAERGLELTREAFVRRGLDGAWRRVLAQVVQPGVEFGDEAVYPYPRGAAAGLRAFSESRGVVFEAHSTDYQSEDALRALVEDHFAILKVGPELTFAFREAVFALEDVERELLERRAPSRLSGLRRALDAAMTRDPRYWKAYHLGGDEDGLRLRRQFSLSDRARYYWPVPEVQKAVQRLFANLDTERLPRGVVSQYLPDAVRVAEEGPPDGQAARIARLHVKRVLARYARACGAAASSVAAGARLPI